MTLTIDISPQTQSRLQEKAARSGLALPEYVQQIVEKTAADTPGPTQRGAAVLAVLDSFMAQDEQEHKDTLATLRKALDEDRPGQRRIFSEGLNLPAGAGE